MSKNVLIATQSAFKPAARDAAVALLKEAGYNVHVLEKYSDASELHAALKNAHAVIVRSDKIDKAAIDAAPELQLVVRAGAGYNTIDVEACSGRSITVMNTPGQNSNAVAELSAGLMVNLVRNLNKADSTTKAGEFAKSKLGGTELRGKKIGIHGFGYIGQLVAEIAGGFGMDIYAYDPWVRPSIAEEKGATLVDSIEALYKDAHFISVHIPKTKETENSINYALLSTMSENGVVVNAARSEVIHYDDLEKLLSERPNFKYGADVHPEGDVPGDKRLAKFGEQVMLLPHIGASTVEANFNAATAAARQSIDFFQRGKMDAAVNKDVVPYWLSSYGELACMMGDLVSQFGSSQPMEVSVICYNELEGYTAAFADCVLKGALGQYGKELTVIQARDLAQKNGVKTITDIKPDNKRGHGNAITVDYLAEGKEGVTRVSVRGRVSEDVPVISRIGEFKNVDFIPQGVLALFQYEEKEGMMDTIGEAFTKAGYNKKQGRFIQNVDGSRAIAVFQVENKGGETELADVKAIAKTLDKDIAQIYQSVVCDFR